MKFLVDVPLSPALAVWLREHGHDAVHAVELGLDRAPDVDILARAKQERRTIVPAAMAASMSDRQCRDSIEFLKGGAR